MGNRYVAYQPVENEIVIHKWRGGCYTIGGTGMTLKSFPKPIVKIGNVTVYEKVNKEVTWAIGGKGYD